MRMGRLVARCLLGVCALGACSVDEGGEGSDCVRSTECALGLVCIEGACSSDLAAIADLGEVPELMTEAGTEMAVPDASERVPDAGGMDMMMVPADAALPPEDAAMQLDGG
jgi:hypothetical protein